MLPIKSPSDNKIIQWLTVTIDIDDQRRAVQLKSNFLANMSHELRTYVFFEIFSLNYATNIVYLVNKAALTLEANVLVANSHHHANIRPFSGDRKSVV